MRKRLLLLLALLPACAPPPPAVVPSTAPPPAAEISTIVIPIQASLAPLVPLVEAQVPKEMAKLDAWELDPAGRFGLKYRVTREPIALAMLGAGLHADVTVHYALEGCKRTVNPVNKVAAMWPCVSCGFREPMRDAHISLQSRFDWTENWTIQSKTAARPVEFPNRCTVTFASIDITDWKLGPLVNEQLQNVARTIDRNTPALTNVRKQAQEIWSSLQAPYEIAPRTWLVLEPVDVALAPVRGNKLIVTSTLSLHARTRVVVGTRPPAATQPLPRLGRAVEGADNGIRVPVDVQMPYEEASRFLSRQFGGKSYDVGGARLAVEAIRVTHGGGDRVAVEADIDYRGGTLKNYRGVIYLQGRLAFDAASKTIALPDLDYSLDRKRRNPFIRTANRFAHEAVRSRLRENARWPVAAQTAAIREEVQRGLARQLAPNVFLRGTVDAIEPAAILALPEGIIIRAVATGSASVEIR